MGLLAYLGAFWAVSYVYHRFLSGRRRRALRNVKMFKKHLVARIRLDSDILLEKNLGTLNDTVAEIDEILTNGKDMTVEELEKKSKGLLKRVEKACPTKNNASMRETVEMVVVVFGIVMGIRAVVMQPFKIPTGSMQPTLYGIHFEDRSNEEQIEIPGPLKAIWNWVNYSSKTINVVVQQPGEGESIQDGTTKIGPISLSSKTIVTIGNRRYELPGPVSAIEKIDPMFERSTFIGRQFESGDIVARGDHLTGDHIMVDRLSYKFTEPARGDVFVFVTDGLGIEGYDPEGKRQVKIPLSGRHYIKRLVGLPNDTLMIKDNKLWVKESGKADFVLVDGTFHKAFDRIYSHKGGYHGYTTNSLYHKYFANDGDTVTLKKDQYFAMGDNSSHSSDSRYWGFVPRKNIIGKALLVWWPFSRRWGLVDRAEPLD